MVLVFHLTTSFSSGCLHWRFQNLVEQLQGDTQNTQAEKRMFL